MRKLKKGINIEVILTAQLQVGRRQHLLLVQSSNQQRVFVDVYRIFGWYPLWYLSRYPLLILEGKTCTGDKSVDEARGGYSATVHNKLSSL